MVAIGCCQVASCASALGFPVHAAAADLEALLESHLHELGDATNALESAEKELELAGQVSVPLSAID